MSHRATRLGLPVLLILATTGCSLAFAHGPPDGHAGMAEFTCTSKYSLPIFEGAWGALFLGGGLGTDSYGSAEMAALGGVLLLDAGVGFWKVNKCRDALEELRTRSLPDPLSP